MKPTTIISVAPSPRSEKRPTSARRVPPPPDGAIETMLTGRFQFVMPPPQPPSSEAAPRARPHSAMPSPRARKALVQGPMYQSAKETTSLPQRAALDVYLKTAPGGFRKAPTMKPRPTSPKLMPSTDYGPPPPPKPSWPPEHPPTLEQMERDMAAWASMRNDVVLAQYEGRVIEHERAKSAFVELVARHDAVEREVEALRARNAELEKVEAEAKQVKVAELARQAFRRMRRSDLDDGWQAWMSFWQAKVQAMRKLRKVASKLLSAEKVDAFKAIKAVAQAAARAKAKLELQKKVAALTREVVELKAAYARLEEESKGREERAAGEAGKMVQELRHAMMAMEKAHEAAIVSRAQAARAEAAATREALATQEERATRAEAELATERATVAELRAELDAAGPKMKEREEAILEEEKKKKLELAHQAAARRLLYRDVRLGWESWFEYWDSRVYAKGRLREVANRLRSPAISHAFYFWQNEMRELNRKKEIGKHDDRFGRTLAKLEQREKEIKKLQERIMRLSGGTGVQGRAQKRKAANEKRDRARMVSLE